MSSRPHHHVLMFSVALAIIVIVWFAAFQQGGEDILARPLQPGAAASIMGDTAVAEVPTGAIVLLAVGGTEVRAEVAATPVARARGLSGRAALEPSSGMLFLFDAPAEQRFWMQGMRFPLDFVWIRDGLITGIDAEVPIMTPDGQISVLGSPGVVDAVLEVSAGFAEQYGLTPGDHVHWAVDR